MIPLVWFFFVWIVFMAIFGILTLLTVTMNLRFAPATATTYLTTAIFLMVIFAVLILVIPYLFSIDWSVALPILPS